MADNDALASYFLRRKVTRANTHEETFALFDRICNPGIIPIAIAEQSQIIVGMKSPSETIAEGAEVPPELEVPMFRICKQVQAGSTVSLSPDVSRRSFRALLTVAASAEDSLSVTSMALQAKLAHVLGVKTEEIELHRPLSQYGIDSLVGPPGQPSLR